MIPSEKLYSGIMGTVVFLLTASLFVFWYDKNPELAERHMTVVRFGFYRVIGIEVLCGLAVAWCVRKKFRFCPLDAVVGLLGAYVFLHSFGKETPAEYRTELWILFVVLYFLLRMLSSLHRNAVGVMLFVLVGAGWVETLYGFGQLYGWFASGHSLYRLTGSFFNPGPYSGFLVMVLPVVLFYCLTLPKPQDTSIKGKHWWSWLGSGFVWGCLLLILSILPAGMSRSSWLAAIAGGGVVLVMHYKLLDRLREIRRKLGRKAWWVTGLCLVLLFLFLGGIYLLKKDSADGRRLMWKISAQAMAEKPLTGVGLGNFGGAFGKAQADYFAAAEATEQEERVAGSPEYGFNEYLQLGVELGWAGLILFLGVLGFAAWQLLHSGWSEKAGILGGLAAFAVFAFFSYPLSVIPLLVVLVLFLAIAGTMNDPSQLTQGMKLKGRVWLLPAGALLLSGITWRIVENKEGLKQAFIRWGEEQRYFSMDIFEETVDHYRELYPLLKDQPKFLFEYGQCLSKTGQYEEGIGILSEGSRLSADPMFYNIMGKNAQALGRYEEAEHCFLQAAHMVPHRLYPLYLLAKMYFVSGQTEKGRETAWLVIRKKPKVMSDAVREMKIELKELLD